MTASVWSPLTGNYQTNNGSILSIKKSFASPLNWCCSNTSICFAQLVFLKATLYVFRTLDKRNFGSWLLMPHAIFKLTNLHPICASWHVICVLLRTIEMIHVTFHELSIKHVQINVPGLQIKNLTNVILERIESSSQVTHSRHCTTQSLTIVKKGEQASSYWKFNLIPQAEKWSTEGLVEFALRSSF